MKQTEKPSVFKRVKEGLSENWQTIVVSMIATVVTNLLLKL